MSVEVELLLPAVASATGGIIFTSGRRRRRPSPLALLPEHTMLSEPARKLDLSARREGLQLNFQRSISEPQGGKKVSSSSSEKGSILCPPADIVLSPPSCSPSLHPNKRCKMSGGGGGDLVAPPTTQEEVGGANINKKKERVLLLHPPPGSVSLPTSPCSESSTLQRTLLLKSARTVDAEALATKLMDQQPLQTVGKRQEPAPYLLIDCRPFIACNVSHISGAINVNCCNRYNRRRLQQGKAVLADLATTKEGKEVLKRRDWKEVVVYDDCSESLEKLPAGHTLFLVLNALLEDQREPAMLLGGFRDFKTSFRSLCEDHLVSPQDGDNLLPDLPSPAEGTKDIENHPATRVLPHLYLGNMRDASDNAILHELGVGYVLNVTSKPPTYDLDPSIRYKQLVASDNGLQNLRQFFEEAFEFIDLAKGAHGRVLVHCQAGISRSPTIAVAYLMKYYPMNMADAYKFVKTRRSIISPNLNFMGQLWEFEQGLKGHQAKRDLPEISFSDPSSPADPQSSLVIQARPDPKQKSLVAAIEDACNATAEDLWSEKVAASSTSTRIESGSV